MRENENPRETLEGWFFFLINFFNFFYGKGWVEFRDIVFG